MKAFVTGATGFLGTHLIRALDREGWEIVALHRPASDLRELRTCKRVELVPGERRNVAETLYAARTGAFVKDAVVDSLAQLGLKEEDVGIRFG